MIPYLSVTSVCCHQLGLTEVGVTGACKGTVAPGGQWGHQLGLGSVPDLEKSAREVTEEEGLSLGEGREGGSYHSITPSVARGGTGADTHSLDT